MKKKTLLHLLTLTMLFGFNSRLFSQESNLFEYKTIDQIKELFAQNDYSINEITNGVSSDQIGSDIYTTSFNLANKIKEEYPSKKTISILDNTLNILHPYFKSFNPTSIIYSVKGEFVFHTASSGYQIKYPFMAFIGSNSFVFIIKDIDEIKQMEIAVPSFLGMSITNTALFSIAKIETPKKAAPLVFGEVKDIDGNTYKTVMIGSQTWMAENLRVENLNDGTEIPYIKKDKKWEALTSLGYTCYAFNEEIKPLIGCHYNFYTIETKKLCPIGWHIPTTSEFNLLINNLGGELTAGPKLMLISTRFWESQNTKASNESKFSAIGSGEINSKGLSQGLKLQFYLWSSDTYNLENGHGQMFSLSSMNAKPLLYHTSKNKGLSVRCVKD